MVAPWHPFLSTYAEKRHLFGDHVMVWWIWEQRSVATFNNERPSIASLLVTITADARTVNEGAIGCGVIILVG